MNREEDLELIRRVQSGEPAAIGELFVRYWRPARSAGFAVTREWAAAEDAASAGLWEALEQIQMLQDPACFASWLRTIVIRKARVGWKHRAAGNGLLLEGLVDPGEVADERWDRYELAGLLRRAVDRLPEELREVIALHYFEGYAPAEAAVFLDIPAGTFRRRLHEARRRLRVKVEEILKGGRMMDRSNQERIERLKQMLAEGDLEAAMRGIFALRPVPEELVELLRQRRGESVGLAALAHNAARMVEGVGGRVEDGENPVAAVAAAIRGALPDFQEWDLSLQTSAGELFGGGGSGERLAKILPPGFAEGKPGAFVRATRGIRRIGLAGASGSIHTMLASDVCAEKADLRIGVTEVLDLTWMVEGELALHDVQELVRGLGATVLPQGQARFSVYSEPRYRAAFAVHFAGVEDCAAVGGVLAGWPGCPSGVETGYVRIFLEAWASVKTGRRVELVELPQGV